MTTRVLFLVLLLGGAALADPPASLVGRVSFTGRASLPPGTSPASAGRPRHSTWKSAAFAAVGATAISVASQGCSCSSGCSCRARPTSCLLMKSGI